MPDGIPIIQGRDPLGGLRQALTGFVGGTIEQVRNQQLAQQLGGLFPGQGFGGITDPRALQAAVQLGLQQAKPLPRETESQFTAVLGNKISQGTATEQEKDIFERLTATPSTVINLGTPSPTERTAIAEGRASVDALDNLKTLFDSSQTVTGPVAGRIEPTKGLFGLTTDEQESFMAATSAFKNAIIKQITGAQMSEQEANRIMKQVPDITDPPARWRAKFNQSKKNLDFLEKRRLEVLEQSGLRVPGQTPIRIPARKPARPRDIPPPPGQAGITPGFTMENFREDFGIWERTTAPKVWTKLPRHITSNIKELLGFQQRWSDIVKLPDIKAALDKVK